MVEPGCKRFTIVWAVVLYVLAGIPVWWHTTKIPRPSLPHARMQHAAQDVAHARPMLPIHVHVHTTGVGSDDVGLAHALYFAMLGHMHATATEALYVSVTREEQGGHCSHTHWSSTTAQGHASAGGNTPCLGLTSLDVASWSQLDAHGVDAVLHGLLQTHGAATPGHYHLFLLPGEAPVTPERLVVGQYRHAWLWPGSQPQEAMQQAAPLLARTWGMHHGLVTEQPQPHLPFAPSGHLMLCFHLCNAEPDAASGFATWDFEWFEAAYLDRVMQVLGPVAQITVQSQVRLFTPARAHGRWSKKHGAHVLKPSKLPFFLDSDWSLDFGLPSSPAHVRGVNASVSIGNSSSSDITASHVASHVLHIVLYVPPASTQPLILLDDQVVRLASNSFWIPGWGGVHVLPRVWGQRADAGTERAHGLHAGRQALEGHGYDEGQQAAGEQAVGGEEPVAPGSTEPTAGSDQGRQAVQLAGARGQPLAPGDLHLFAQATVATMRQLLGLPAAPSGYEAGHQAAAQMQVLPAPSAGFAAWEVDALQRVRAVQDVHAAAHTLGSLSRMVEELPNLEVPELIGQQVAEAMQALSAALSHIRAGSYSEASYAARAAATAAEAAYAHPSILARLSFPQSHKLGVYLPLFLPALIAIAQGWLRETLHFVRRRRAQHQAKPSLEELDQKLMLAELQKRQQS